MFYKKENMKKLLWILIFAFIFVSCSYTSQKIEKEEPEIKIENISKKEIELELKNEEIELKNRFLEEKKENQQIINEKNNKEDIKEEDNNSTSLNFLNWLKKSNVTTSEINDSLIERTIWEEIDKRINRVMLEVEREVREYLKKD